MKKQIKILPLVVTCLFSFLFLLVVFFPFTIIELDGGIQPLEEVHKAGDVVEYKFEYCKYIQIRGTVQISLTPTDNPYNVSYSLENRTSNIPPSCGTRYSKVGLPMSLESGEYYLRASVNYFPFKAFQTQVYEGKIRITE